MRAMEFMHGPITKLLVKIPVIGRPMLSLIVGTLLTGVGLAAATIPAAIAQPESSADAVAQLDALYSGPGVVLRGPENCVGSTDDPWADPAVLNFCAVKDIVGALGGPSSGASATDFVEMPNRFEYDQPTDCAAVGAVADGEHDGCSVITGAATLLRAGLPVRLFGICAKALPKDCAVLGTITDPSWTTDDVYLLMDPALVDVHCQYAQDADRNGCNAGGAFTAGQTRPTCSAGPTNPMCEYGPDQQAEMIAAYTDYCTKNATDCLENQLEAQWRLDSIVAVGYVRRLDQPNDCAGAAAKATSFTDAVNAKWATQIPIVQIDIDVARNSLTFGEAGVGCVIAES